MAIRKDIVWTVGEDLSVHPTAPQEGGVQGESNAVQVKFDLGAQHPLVTGGYQLYIECEDPTGAYDKTDALTVKDGAIAVDVPLAWTQYGGTVKLNVVAEKEGERIESGVAEKKRERIESGVATMVFRNRNGKTKKMKTLIQTLVQKLLDTASDLLGQAADVLDRAKVAASDASQSAHTAGINATAAATAGNAAAESAQDATAAAALAEDAAETAIDAKNACGTYLPQVLTAAKDAAASAAYAAESAEQADAAAQRAEEDAAAATAAKENATAAAENAQKTVEGKLSVYKIEGCAFAIGDEDGNITFGIKENGETVGTFTDKAARDKLAPLTTTPDYAYAVCDDYGNVVFAITHAGEVKYVGKGEGGGGSTFVPTFDYTKCGLPVLALTGDTSAMTKDDAVTLDYTLKTPKGTTIVSGACTCKWQGSSSVRRGYPKRNYTIKFDTEFEATAALGNQGEREVKTQPWGAQKKYCMKANWIDPSGARNVVLAKLWGSIVASRHNTHAKLLGSPNSGAIDGFPVIIAINGEFTGLYTFNIPKDGWMFNMGDGAAEYVVCGESNSMSACGFYAEATFVEGDSQADTDFAFEYQPDDVEDAAVVESFNGAIRAVMNAPNSPDWEAAVAPYFDIDSAIDYYIFVCCIGGMDNLRKNILYGTYDGVKWFMSAYDLDTTLGSNPYGTGLYPVKTSKTQFYEAANGSGKHRLFELIYKYSRDKLKERYAELRSTLLSDETVWYAFNNFVNAIPRSVYDADAEKWLTMPATTTANVENYMQYYRMHCALLDKEMEE